MYFSLRNHTLYSWAMQLTDMQRNFLTGVIFTILWTIWFYGIYSHNKSMIADYHQSIAKLQDQGTCIARFVQEHNANLASISKLQDLIDSYVLSEHVVIQSRMIGIIKQIKQLGLFLTGCNVGKNIDKGWHTRHTIHIDVVGSMEALLQLFASIKATNKMIQCTQMRIERTDTELFHLTADLYVISLKDKKIPST